MRVKIMENKRGESMNEIIGKVIKELEHVFDVLSASIKNNRERIVVLERRIKEIEDTFIIKEDK